MATRVIGYFALALSLVGYLATRAAVAPFLYGDADLVPTLTLGLFVLVVSLLLGMIGTRFLVVSRGTATALSLAQMGVAAPPLAGLLLTLTDSASANGFNGFGSIIMIGVSDYVLTGGALLSGITAISCGVRRYQLRHAPRDHSHETLV